MRILFVVDGRSTIALNWISYFIGGEHEVHLASTFPCEPPAGLASFAVVPVAFSQAKSTAKNPAHAAGGAERKSFLWSAGLVGLRTRFRQWLGPLTFQRAGIQLAHIIQHIHPELVHAMRIPYEGIISALAFEKLPSPQPPLLISVWGNDFTLHAVSNPWMAAYTRRTMGRASALHTDCTRDQRLASEWNFAKDKPTVVLPGGGGVQKEIFYPPSTEDQRGQLVINPRGVRAYVRNDTFFKSIPRVLERVSGAHFVCPTMAGNSQAERWISDLGIGSAVQLLPHVSREEMAALFRRSQVAVSPAFHDGTPNTLLEALACGCYPVAGDIESLREWITPGVNGALVDPGDPQALAGAICEALEKPELRKQAAEYNHRLIAERAEYGKVMQAAEKFYIRIISS